MINGHSIDNDDVEADVDVDEGDEEEDCNSGLDFGEQSLLWFSLWLSSFNIELVAIDSVDSDIE